MFAQLLEYKDVGLFILRLAVAVIFLSHGLPKLKNYKVMAGGLGVSNMSWLVIILGLVETISSVGLIFGIYVHIASLLLCIVMIGAIWFKTLKWHIPFMAMDKTGWEFDLILLAANMAILLSGGGSIGIQ